MVYLSLRQREKDKLSNSDKISMDVTFTVWLGPKKKGLWVHWHKRWKVELQEIGLFIDNSVTPFLT